VLHQRRMRPHHLPRFHRVGNERSPLTERHTMRYVCVCVCVCVCVRERERERERTRARARARNRLIINCILAGSGLILFFDFHDSRRACALLLSQNHNDGSTHWDAPDKAASASSSFAPPPPPNQPQVCEHVGTKGNEIFETITNSFCFWRCDTVGWLKMGK